MPVDPVTILALDENVGYLLLDLVDDPSELLILGSFSAAAPIPIAAEYGITVEPFDISNPSIEAIAALAPNLIVGTEHPSIVEHYDVYSAVAPTVLVPFTANWVDQVALVGETIGAEDRATARIDWLEAEIDRVGERITDELDGDTSVAVIGSLGGQPFALPTVGVPAGELLGELGLERPAAETQDVDANNPFISFSTEVLLDHDADYVFVMSGNYFEADAEQLRQAPLFSRLAGEVTDVDGESWSYSHAFAVAWMLADIEAVLLDGEPAATTADALERWTTYTDA